MSVGVKIGSIFSLVGIPIFVGGLYWTYNSVKLSRSTVDVLGSVSENIQDECRRSKNKGTYTCFQPVVQYQHAGKKYEVALSERSSSQYKIGEKFSLKLDPKNPGSAISTSELWYGPLFFTLFGAVFGSVGVGFLRSHFRRKKLEAELLVTGTSIRASVIEVGLNRFITVNGANPFKVRAQFSDPITNTPVVAQSPDLWYDPVQAGEISEDNTVEVLYDPKDAKRCMIVLGKTRTMKAA
jgi:hypothetical protein